MSEPGRQSVRGWQAIRLVAGREIATRLASRAFRITSILMVVGVVAFILVLKLTSGESTSTVGLTPGAAPLAQPLTSAAASIGEQVETTTIDQRAGEEQVLDGNLDALVVGSADEFRVVVRRDLSPELRSAFTVLVRQIALNEQLRRAGADPVAVTAAVDAASFEQTALEPAREYQSQRLALGVIIGIFTYIAMMVYGQIVAQGVVEEKASRIVELLLTTIRPWQLMVGKVVGIGLVGLGQLLLVALVGLVTGIATDTVSFPTSIAAGVTGWAVLWFLLGYVAYALMFAALGALVSRQEDVGGVTAPALMLIILPYVLGISILPADPENQPLAIASLIPFFSPTLMPMRIAMGVAPLWQVVVSVVLTIALIVVLVWLAGRIYGNAVLRLGTRVRIRDALRSAT